MTIVYELSHDNVFQYELKLLKDPVNINPNLYTTKDKDKVKCLLYKINSLWHIRGYSLQLS